MGGLEHYLKTGMDDGEELCAWAEGIEYHGTRKWWVWVIVNIIIVSDVTPLWLGKRNI